MYLSSTDKIEVVLSGAITTVQLQCVASYQDVNALGLVIPQSSNQTLTNNTTAVTLVGSPVASTNRQVVQMSVFNADSVAATVTVKKDVSATDYVLVTALLQSGDTLQWSSSLGWSILKQSTQESVLFTVFDSSGTWTKRAGLKSVLAVCVGSGGGGGAGRRGAAGSNRFGGGGGGGGAVVFNLIPASSLSSTVSVTIGAGGTGGAGQTVDDNNGANGTAGGVPATPDGGNGGNYGAGAGGGSGVLNGTTSGAGGDGAGGLCVIMEMY
jgi:hypothetical protein